MYRRINEKVEIVQGVQIRVAVNHRASGYTKGPKKSLENIFGFGKCPQKKATFTNNNFG